MIKRRPVVTVIMPVFNCGEHIEESICSILNQTFSNFELVIVDDGSTDNSSQIIEAYSNADSRIVALFNEDNKGISFSLNRALRIAKAPFIIRMDADDYAVPDRFELQVKFMYANKNIDVCGTALEVYERPGNFWTPPLNDAAIRCRLLFESCIYHPTVIMRKHVALQGGGYPDTAPVEDYDLWSKLSFHKSVHFANIAEPLLKYRVYPGSISRSVYKKLQLKRLQRVHIDQIKNLGIIASKEELESHFILSKPNGLLSPQCLPQCAKWMQKIKKANSIERIFAPDALDKELHSRWYNLCLTLAAVSLKAPWVYLIEKEAPKGRCKMLHFMKILAHNRSIFSRWI